MTLNYPRFTFPDEKVFDVPPAFWADHVYRGCRCAEDCPNLKAHETDDVSNPKSILMNAEDANELGSDASYYTDAVSFMGSAYLGLQSSARATIKRLEGYARNPGMTRGES